jgi:hypothetical protein
MRRHIEHIIEIRFQKFRLIMHDINAVVCEENNLQLSIRHLNFFGTWYPNAACIMAGTIKNHSSVPHSSVCVAYA